MIEIEKPQIECTETPGDATYGKYVVEPLERGYGTTLGNALRRIMLSSLPGTAPTTIKIAGVQHEFSTIPGVKEDVTEIVLNVKGLLTKLHCETVKTVYIEAVGPCKVTAGDIKADGEVEVLNPDLHIATLDNGATLNMEITLSHGRGYVPADRNKPQQNVIGTIAAAIVLAVLVYLLVRKVISPRIPLAYIGTVAVLAFLFPMGNDRLTWMAAQVLGGGLMLGAIFMATDYVTSPITKPGQILYGIGCGVLTIMIRYFGGYNEGVSYAILIMNCCVVLLDRIGRPTKFGAPAKKRKEAAGK